MRIIKIAGLLLVSCVFCVSSWGKTYKIYKFEQLKDIEKDLAGEYLLMNDIDADEKDMSSIKGVFTGSLHGNHLHISRTISNINIDEGHGLFETLNGAKISFINLKRIIVSRSSFPVDNLGCLAGEAKGNTYINHVCFLDSYVSGGNNIGGLIGHSIDSVFSFCHIEDGTVRGIENVGGLVGINDSSTIVRCYSKGIKITANGCSLGGLVGWNKKYHNSQSVIKDCHATKIEVDGGRTCYNVGGLVGFNRDALIKLSSFSGGSVTGKNVVGGLVGKADMSTLDKVSVKEAKISSFDKDKSYVGGLIGYSGDHWIHIYEASVWHNVAIEGGNYTGGLIGRANHMGNKSNILNSYSQATITGGDKCVGGFMGHAYQHVAWWRSGDVTSTEHSYFAGSIDKKRRKYTNAIIGEIDDNGYVQGKYVFWSIKNKGSDKWNTKGSKGSKRVSEKELKSETLYINAEYSRNVWNFHPPGYPTLKWEDDLVSSFSDDTNFDNDALAL